MTTEQIRDKMVDHPDMPRVGSTVSARYEVLSVLGEGGFAVVYKARDHKLGGVLALKVLDPRKSNDPAFVQRFQQEISIVRALRHHNTVKIWDAGQTETCALYCAMELVEGEQLTRLIYRSRGLPVDRVIRITNQILRSLSEAHRLGIVHRDLKPGNIMVNQLPDEPDYIKVLDFGIAKVRATELARVKTQTGLVMCTPKYAAPEVLRNEGVGPSSDLYALGLIMAEMLTGQAAIQAPSIPDEIALQISLEPVVLDPRIHTLHIASVISRSLEKKIADRYPSSAEMLADLRTCPKGEVFVPPAPPTPSAGIPSEAPVRTAIAALHEAKTMYSPQQVPGPASGCQPQQEQRRKMGVAVLALAVLMILIGVGTTALLIGGKEAPEKAQDETAEVLRRGAVPPAVTVEVSQPPDGVSSAQHVTTGSEERAEVAPAYPAGVVAPPGERASADQQGGEPGSEEPAADIAVLPDGNAPDAPRVVTLHLTSSPDHASVYVDGEEVGDTPLHLEVESANEAIAVRLRRRNYQTRRFSVAVFGGEFTRHIRLRRERSDAREEGSADESSTDTPGLLPLFND